jgi:hypothetical protein
MLDFWFYDAYNQGAKEEWNHECVL